MCSVGNQIGVGKESGVFDNTIPFDREAERNLVDIYVVADSEGNEMVLKLHRLVPTMAAERIELNLI